MLSLDSLSRFREKFRCRHILVAWLRRERMGELKRQSVLDALLSKETLAPACSSGGANLVKINITNSTGGIINIFCTPRDLAACEETPEKA